MLTIAVQPNLELGTLLATTKQRFREVPARVQSARTATTLRSGACAAPLQKSEDSYQQCSQV
jgi:hypothetical protein